VRVSVIVTNGDRFNHRRECIGGFYACLGNHNSLYAKAMRTSLAIEHAQSVRFRKLWLESDSTLLFQAFSYADVVPWILDRGEKVYEAMCWHGLQNFSYF